MHLPRGSEDDEKKKRAEIGAFPFCWEGPAAGADNDREACHQSTDWRRSFYSAEVQA